MTEIKKENDSTVPSSAEATAGRHGSGFTDNWARRILKRCGFRAPEDVAGALLRRKLFAQRRPPSKSNLLPFVPGFALILFCATFWAR